MENIKQGRRALYDSKLPTLLCLQVSSTPNLIALISQLNIGRQKKDNSHPFWGRIRGVSVWVDGSKPGGAKHCPVVEEGVVTGFAKPINFSKYK